MKTPGEVVMDIWTEGSGSTEEGKGYLLPSVIEKLIESRDAEIHAQYAPVVEALEYFVRRVEEGSIRSVKTYAMFKDALAAIKEVKG